MCDYGSPYAVYPTDKKRKVIVSDFMKEDEWKEDKDIMEAMEAYLKFQETHTMRLMKAAKGASDKLAGYFEGVLWDVDVIKRKKR